MSLYNMLIPTNKGIIIAALSMLGTSPAKVPRFRDAYFDTNDDGEPQIVIYTRTGGGNRPWYENAESAAEENGDKPEDHEGPFNDDLRALPGFVRDYDDDFDSTYAYFVFEVPADFREDVKAMLDKTGKPATPTERFRMFIEALGAPKERQP